MFANALALLAGMCLVHGLPALPEPRFWAPVCALALLASLALRCPRAAWCIAGITWAWGNAAWRLSHDLPATFEGADIEIGGFVASLPEVTASGSRFSFDVIEAPAEATRFPRRIELNWYDAPVLPAAGEQWRFTVRLRRRHGFANPGGFDYEAQLFREGIGATGYIRDSASNQRLAAPGMRYAILRVRGLIAARLEAALAGHAQLGLVQGLVIGERQNMTAGQWQVFAATGTSHLMAISGLHIAMVAALSALLGGGLVRLPRMQQRRFTAVDGRAAGGIAGALVYAALAGFGVPAQRTLVMLGIWWGSQLLRRELRPTQGLGLSLIAVLAIDPFAPLSVGAWLSFGAVTAILALVTGRLHHRKRKRSKIREFLNAQGAVTVGLLPLLVLAFGAVSLVSPLVNLVAIPFFTLLIVPLALTGTAVLLLWPGGGQFVLHLATVLLDAAWPVLVASSQWPFAVWHPAAGPLWTTVCLAFGAALALAPGFLPTRLAGLLLCFPALFWRPAALAQGEFRLTVLDVGQGLAAVVETRSHTLLYDAGPAFQSGRNTGEMVVLPFLRSRGVRRLDAVVGSHGDLDHVGGLPAVLESMPVIRVMASPSVMLKPAPEPCERGRRWQWDGVEFTFLHPDPDAGPQSDNEASCVLRIAGPGGSALLLGDIERRSEADIVARGLVRPTDIVVAAHHGSRTSSSADFVSAVRAKHVLFAVGYRNRWGFPRPEVVARWRDAGAIPSSTSDEGAISLEVHETGIEPPLRHRASHRRYWHAPGP